MTELKTDLSLALDMTPPKQRVKGYLIPEEKKFTLMCRNSGNSVRLDEADFKTICMIAIYEWKGEVVTKNKTPITVYLNIKGTRCAGTDKMDYRRVCYA